MHAHMPLEIASKQQDSPHALEWPSSILRILILEALPNAQGTYQDFPVNWLTGYLGVKEPKDSTITMDQIEYILVSAC